MKFGFRFLIPMIGLTVLAGTTLATDMSASGHARTRMEITDNTGFTDTDAVEHWNNRVRLNLDLSPAKGLNVRLAPQMVHGWGATDTAANSNPRFMAHEAYMSWAANDRFTLLAGRRVVDYGTGLIFGASDWGRYGNSWDNAALRTSYDMGYTDLAWVKLGENTPFGTNDATTDSDSDMFYTYTALKPNMGMLKAFDFYAIWQEMRGAAETRFFTLGARAAGEHGMIDMNAELAAQFGKRANVSSQKGFMGNLEVGAKLMEKHRAALSFDYANTEWNNIAPTNHQQLGLSDIFARGNIIAIGLLTKWHLNDSFMAKLNGYYFMKANSDYTSNGSAVNSDKALAMEGNLLLTYMANGNLNFDLGYNLDKGFDGYVASGKTYQNFLVQGTMTF